MHFVGVFNKDSGTFRTIDMEAFADDAARVFADRGHTLDARIVEGNDLEAELLRAARDPACEALLAGGGDGTISAAAGICFANDKVLGVLPAGTMNLFARSLSMPLQLNAAVEAIAGGEVSAIDIATANGRPFVHQFSVGFHSRLIRIRNGLAYRSRWGKMLASLRAITLALSKPLVFDADITTRQGTERRKATAIAVSNNVLGEGHVPYAEVVDRGMLGVYVVDPMPPLRLARFALSLAIGKWKAHPLVSEKEVAQVSLRFPRRKASAQAVIDGELIPLERTIDLRIHAGGLRVVMPGASKVESSVAPVTEVAQT